MLFPKQTTGNQMNPEADTFSMSATKNVEFSELTHVIAQWMSPITWLRDGLSNSHQPNTGSERSVTQSSSNVIGARL